MLFLLPACGFTGSVADTVAVIGGDRLSALVAIEPSSGSGPVSGDLARDPKTMASGIEAGSASESLANIAATGSSPGPTSAPGSLGFTDAMSGCTVGTALRSLGLDSFYQKVCTVKGLAVVSSSVVADAALEAAGEILHGMLAPRPDLVAAMSRGHFRLGVIGQYQRAVELPEYRDLPANYPRTNWDSARAYGATPQRPLAAAPEENLLCLATDTYPGQSVLVHELGHSVLDMAIVPIDPGFEARIEAGFAAARSLAVYRNTYALTDQDEYWAEGVQDYFDASRAAYGDDGGGDGYDGPIHSRVTLALYDPTLYDLIAEVFAESDWRPSCPVSR